MWKKVVLLLLIAIQFLPLSPLYAEGTGIDYEKKLGEREKILKEIEETEKKVRDLQEKEASLESEITYFDGIIHITQLKIRKTQIEIQAKEEELRALTKEVDKFKDRLYRVSQALSQQEEILTSRLRERYKTERVSVFELFLSSRGLSEIISRLKYLRVAQAQDNKLLRELKEIKGNFTSQKVILEDKKKKVEAIKAEIEREKADAERYKAQLADQREEKQYLLVVTQKDEQKYQERLKALREDERAIREELGLITSDIAAGLVSGQDVKKGDVIGLQGNTGNVYPRPSDSCPTCGTHLHFMIFTCFEDGRIPYNCIKDPSSYINGEDGYHKPLDYERITQGFGYTSFARSGLGGYDFHTGIDLVAYYGAPVYAIDDGTIYYGTDSAGGKYALIKHSDDFWSAYWHLK